ncbi:MAG: hypothetical protein H0V80_14595, partial [Acidobacteria bacterium]|nr:hypothetical protein [Acidobacteriota bacterium]
LIARFDLAGISGGDAVFNPEKLEWMNNQHLMRLPDDVLVAQVRPWLERAGLWRDTFDTTERAWLIEALALLRPRAKRLGDIPDGLAPLAGEVVFDDVAVAKHVTVEVTPHLQALADTLAGLDEFGLAEIERAVRGTAEAGGARPGAFMQAVRVCLTGRTVSPGLFETIALLGRERSVDRLRAGARQAQPS